MGENVYNSITALLLLLSLLSSPGSTASPLSYLCEDYGQYTPNTSFDSNLKLLLSNLTSNASSSFLTSFKGDLPSIAYGLAICFPDATSSSCHSCLATAAQDLPHLCPYYYRAVIWYDDCELRYTNLRFFSSVDNSIVPCIPDANGLGVEDHDRFESAVTDLMVRMSDKASRSPNLFATGKVNSSGSLPAIYGIVMCTRDLSAVGCGGCLEQIRIQIPRCFEGKYGGRVLGKSCSLRYDVRGFLREAPDIVLAYRSSSPSAAGAPQIPPVREGNKSDKGKILGGMIPLVVVFLLGISICTCYWRRKRKSSADKGPNINDFEAISNVEVLFDLSILRVATDNFSDRNKLGQGGFGAVYKGTLADGQEVAVKRLSAGSAQGFGELKNELVLVAKLQHKNLVRIFGVCLEEQEKLIIYEFMPSGSLDTFIFDPVKRKQLQWSVRQKIIEGVARGLLYLHEESRLRIIHRDLKSSNILLDADMNPKISDFGLARLFGGEQTQGITGRIVGTFGYMAPEYAMRGHFSTKCDVYSFGVLILEIITGRNNSSFNDPNHDRDLVGYIWRRWINGTILEIVDPYLGDNWSRNEVLRCFHIGLLCVQEDPGARPHMSSVIVMLHSHSVPLHSPSSPAFCWDDSTIDPDQLQQRIKFNASDDSSHDASSMLVSSNNASNTELAPR